MTPRPKAPKPAAGTGAPTGSHSTMQAARICGVSTFSIQRWFDAGLLTGATLPGGRRRIGTASLEAFMRKHVITAQPAERPALSVLLVDDDARLLDVMRESLAAAGGCTVHTASSGLEAGLGLAELKPAVLVIDMELEDVPGEILLNRLRFSAAGRLTRIVALCGKASAADDKTLLQAGANVVLHKPFAMADLAKAVGLKRPARAS